MDELELRSRLRRLGEESDLVLEFIDNTDNKNVKAIYETTLQYINDRIEETIEALKKLEK